MKNRGTAHLNQFWCNSGSKRFFFWGRDAVALVDPGSLMAEGCMATNDARCASQGMREEEKNGRKIEELNESYTERSGVIWRRTAKRGLQSVPSCPQTR